MEPITMGCIAVVTYMCGASLLIIPKIIMVLNEE